MNILTDLHLHSKFSRAVSRDMTIPAIAGWARKKGIDLVATGDWTHPKWLSEIEKDLVEDGTGILKQKDTTSGLPSFLLSTEISSIYSYKGKTRRVHTLVWVPTIASARSISAALTRRGCNILSDGRPIIGLSLIELSELVLTEEPNAIIVPAHIWTPWFSVYGSMGGFESLSEAFGPFEKHILAVETGLSSSPDMNWRIEELSSRAIVSFSDAHSGAKLGREATLFELPHLSFQEIRNALASSSPKTKNTKKNGARIISTIEFYPEEGKYHYSGHRDCSVRLTPEEVISKGTTCSVCGKPLTQGVMQRVEDLALGDLKNSYTHDEKGVRWIVDDAHTRPAFCMSVPLMEIIAEAIGSPVTSKKTIAWYERLIESLGSEFNVLLHTPTDDIAHVSTTDIAEGVSRVRRGDIHIDPGYDGVFGIVKIWKSDSDAPLVDGSREQLNIFS